MGIKIFYMFVVLYQFNFYGANSTNKCKEPKDKGAREFKKLNSFLICSANGLVQQRAPLFIHNQNLFKMLYQKRESTKSAKGSDLPVTEIKDLHASNRQSVINDLFNRPINQLVSDFMVEMDAKNKAYYFILESGMFMQFRDYCLTNENRG